MTISGQKRQICEHTLNFLPISMRPNEFASVCVGFSSEKLQVLKNHQKAKNLGCWKKCLFCFVYSVLKISIIWSVFLYYLEEKCLNYQVTTENKPKMKFLRPKLNKTKKLKNGKSAWIVAPIFEARHQICLFLAKNSQIFEEEYKITVVDKTLVSDI